MPRSLSRLRSSAVFPVALLTALGLSAATAPPDAEGRSAVAVTAARDAALEAVSQVSVRDGRAGLTHDIALALVNAGRCDEGVALLRADPGALGSPNDQLASAGVRAGQSCIAALGATMIQAKPPAVPGLPPATADVHHTGAVLLTIAGRGDGPKLIESSETALAVAAPPPVTLPPNAPPALRAMLDTVLLHEHLQEKLSGRSDADERLWAARTEELSLYEEAKGASDARYRATLDRYAAAALAAGAKASPAALDDLAQRLLAAGDLARAGSLMDAAVRNETDPNQAHSLASRQFDALAEAGRFAQAAALIDRIDPVHAAALVGVAVNTLSFDSPTTLVPYIPAFDRWANGQPDIVAGWLASLALELAQRGATGDARPVLLRAIDRLKTVSGDGDDADATRSTAAEAAAQLGDDALAWSLATPARADHDRYVAIVSGIARGALLAARDASADRALAALSAEERGFVFEGLLGTDRHAPIAARRRIVGRGLAIATAAEPLQAYRIRLGLATETAARADLSDLTAPILALIAPDRRASTTLQVAQRAINAAAMGQRREGRIVALVELAARDAAALLVDEQVTLSLVQAQIGDLAASRRTADAITDRRKRAQAYITLLNWSVARA